MKEDDKRQTAFRAYRIELVNYAANILGSRHDAEDVIQEAFLRYVPEGAGAAADREQGPPRRHPVGGLPQEHGTPEENALICDRVRQMEAILAAMPAQRRIALEMHKFGGYRVEEIARHIDVSVPTAYRFIQMAILELAQKMHGTEPRP